MNLFYISKELPYYFHIKVTESDFEDIADLKVSFNTSLLDFRIAVESFIISNLYFISILDSSFGSKILIERNTITNAIITTANILSTLELLIIVNCIEILDKSIQ